MQQKQQIQNAHLRMQMALSTIETYFTLLGAILLWKI
jgi:hypothetical protein